MTMKLTVLALAVLGILYSIVLEIVRYRSASNPTPPVVADVYDDETYQTWKHYSAAHGRRNLVTAFAAGVITVLLLSTDAYAAFASLFPAGVYWELIAVILFETLISTVLNVASGYVTTMIIEEKYGFNRSTMKTFVIDQIRNFIVSLLLSLALTFVIAGLHLLLGDWVLLLFTTVLFVASLLATFLYPFFSRMANKFVPLEEGDLRTRLMALLTDHGYRVKAIEVMDASRRTTKLNAYFTGFGKMKTIVLYDNLINVMSTEEICAVFAHELGHGLHRDVLKRQLLNIVNLFLVAVVAWVAVSYPSLHTAFGFDGINYGFAYILLGIGLNVIQPFTGIFSNAYSRRAEYRADRQAVREGYGEAMITALKKLSKENFAHLAPSPINVVLEYSHPPLHRRVEEVQKAMQ